VNYGIGYQNAFWNGSQVVYGDNMAADDVVAHEITHAVTQYTSNLIYSYQSGAINESFSDLWGEFIDQANGLGNDAPSVKWLIGEDSALGVIRSMSDPTFYGQPDKMSSPYYYHGSSDNGGVHTNSGVNNKAAYLMVVGGMFNGRTITGIGMDKTAAVYYQAQVYHLTMSANYNDLYYALIQACQNLIGGADGITQNDCQQVKTAAEAVEMIPVWQPNTPTPTTMMGTWTPSTPTQTPTKTKTPTPTFTFTPTKMGTPTGTATATATQPGNQVGVNVWVGAGQEGTYTFPKGGALQVDYPGANAGPVKLMGTTINTLVGSQAVVYAQEGAPLSFSEIMALPNMQLDKVYWLPWYNNADLDTQLRFANVSGSTASVQVYIGGKQMPGSPFSLAPGASIRKSFMGVNAGPVKIVSSQNIVAAERVIYKVNGTPTSLSEMMALPNKHLDRVYWLPWYNNVELGTQLRFANVSGSPASVRVYIGGKQMPGSPFRLAPGASIRKSFAGVNAGPVKIVSSQNIVAAERMLYKVDGVDTSFSEMMALPDTQLDRVYCLPWYDSVNLDTQLRFANVSGSIASVRVYIGGKQMPGSPFRLDPGASIRRNFVGRNAGPVQIVSTVKIVVAERVIQKEENGTPTSYAEIMGLPAGLLDTTYWLPWYNNVELNTQLRFAVP
jgi:hypothetical protein